MEQKFEEFLKGLNIKYTLKKNSIIFFNIHNGNIFEINKELLNEFIEVYILNSKVLSKEHRKIKELFENENLPIGKDVDKVPFHIQWHINDTCNLRCKHCYVDKYSNNGLSLKYLKKIVDDYFKAIKKWGFYPEFSITGGEPLLNKNLFPLLTYIKQKDKNTRMAILTNGILINKKSIVQFKKIGINLVQVSLEGSNKFINDKIRGKGTFDKIIKSLELLKKNKIKTSLHFVISKINYKDVYPYILLAKKLNIDMLTFSNLVPFGTGKQMEKLVLSPQELKKVYLNIDNIAKKLDKKNQLPYIRRTRPLWCNFETVNPQRPVGGVCPVAFNTLTILSDGKVMPCRRLPLIVGDLKKQNFFEIWYTSKVLSNLRDRKKLKACGKCKYLRKCAGCRGLAYVYYHDYMGPDPQCWLVNKNLGDNAKIKKT